MLPFKFALKDIIKDEKQKQMEDMAKKRQAVKTICSMQSVAHNLIAQSTPGIQAQGMAMPQTKAQNGGQ